MRSSSSFALCGRASRYRQSAPPSRAAWHQQARRATRTSGTAKRRLSRDSQSPQFLLVSDLVLERANSSKTKRIGQLFQEWSASTPSTSARLTDFALHRASADGILERVKGIETLTATEKQRRICHLRMAKYPPRYPPASSLCEEPTRRRAAVSIRQASCPRRAPPH